MLINLLRNSYEALNNSENGEIIIKAKLESKGMVSICVSDNGPGIAHDQLEEIFIPFFTTKEKGTGIGLSLSKQIIRQHGGDINVHSEIGQGTEFIILLPA